MLRAWVGGSACLLAILGGLTNHAGAADRTLRLTNEEAVADSRSGEEQDPPPPPVATSAAVTPVEAPDDLIPGEAIESWETMPEPFGEAPDADLWEDNSCCDRCGAKLDGEKNDHDEPPRRRCCARCGRELDGGFEWFLKNRIRGDIDPDIREPGPDSFNFPNSAFTLPPGVIYVETHPFDLHTGALGSRKVLATPYLLRIGLIKNLEFRTLGPGIELRDYRRFTESGFGPITFDFKHHWWDENRELCIPAVGLEVWMQTNLGTAAFVTTQYQPGYSFNFDLSVTEEFVFEWNIGNTYTVDSFGNRFMQLNLAWSLQGPIFDNFETFVHGYTNYPTTNVRLRDGSMIGGGGIWYPNRHVAIYASYSVGVTPFSPRILAESGVAFAF